MPRLSDARSAARGWLRARIADELADSRSAAAAARDATPAAAAAVESVARRVDALERRLERLERSLDRRDGAFSADWTVEDAWRRHPGVQAAFAARHLPACDGCAVRFDETLAEVAQAYDLDLASLLADLNRLIAEVGGSESAPRTL